MEGGIARITLRVYDYVRPNHTVLLAAEKEASEVLAQAGIETRWLDCPTAYDEEPSFPGCSTEWQATDFVVRLLPNAMIDSRAKWQEALGSTNACEGTGTCTANVFNDRVAAMVAGPNAELPVLLGRAMTHEIGHLLLGADLHSRTGIMRAVWSGQDLTVLGRPYLLFTRDQSRQMRSRLAKREQAWQAQVRIEESTRGEQK